MCGNDAVEGYFKRTCHQLKVMQGESQTQQPGPQRLLVNQSSVGGEVRDPDGCTLGEVQCVGQSVDTLLRCYTELCVASRLCGCGEHALSCLHITQNMDSLYIHQEPLTLSAFNSNTFSSG